MTSVRLRLTCIVFILAVVGVVSYGTIANAATVTKQQSLSETYAVSNYGDVLDFETLARSSPQLYGGTGGARFLPPTIPASIRVDSAASAVSPNIIIGSDDRVKVDDTTQFPWSTVVHIHGNFGIYTHLSAIFPCHLRIKNA